MSKPEVRISKFLSYVLRHNPDKIGIILDSSGWTDVDILIERLNRDDNRITKNTLIHIVENDSKKRFSFNDGLDKIRASQGHSVDIELGYVSQKPPKILYHGTGEKSVQSILETGIEKRTRKHVHLSADIETAVKVGQRHGKAYVFEVFAENMYNDKYVFYLSDNGVWLTGYVPTQYLKTENK